MNDGLLHQDSPQPNQLTYLFGYELERCLQEKVEIRYVLMKSEGKEMAFLCKILLFKSPDSWVCF